MISKLSYGNNIFGLISYNEDKVRSGEAKGLLSSNFPKEMEDLTFGEKVQHFRNFTDLNTRSKKNAYHFMISFPPADRHLLSTELKHKIVKDYMKGIGIGDQPFLAYEHFDTQNPHIHIVTTNIDYEGKRIDIYRKVHEKSEPVRKEIELENNLTIAQDHKTDIELLPDIEERLKYGQQPTKANLSKAVNMAMNKFAPTNIEELKHVLSNYGITMDQGREGSIQKEKKGLVYSFMDANGDQKGKGIKASALSNRPTFERLEKNFSNNTPRKYASFKETVKAVNEVFHSNVQFTEKDFQSQLEAKGITCDIIRSDTGAIENIYYTNLKNNTIFSSNEFRLDQNKLRERFGDYSLSKESSRDMGRIVSDAFYQHMREEKIDFESTFLAQVDQKSLLEGIIKSNPQIAPAILRDSFRNYMDYKTTQELIIFEKDLKTFNKRNVPIIRYISKEHFPHNTKDKIKFLKAMGLKVIQKEGRMQIAWSKDPRLSINLGEQDPSHVLCAGDSEDLGLSLSYNKADKRLLYYLAERKHKNTVVPKDVNLYLYKKRSLAPFITEEDVGFIETTINKKYADKMQSLVEADRFKTVQDIMDYGLLIEPLTEDMETEYIARYHDNQREYSIPVTDKLRQFVKDKGYTKAMYDRDHEERYSQHYDNFHLKYRLMANLNRIGVTKTYSGLAHAHEVISKRNNSLGKRISDFMETTNNNKDLSENVKHEKTRAFMLEEIKHITDNEIGRDHLKPWTPWERKSWDSSQWERDQWEKDGKKRTHGKDNFAKKGPKISSDMGIKMQKSSDHEEELRRKKILREFYDELER